MMIAQPTPLTRTITNSYRLNLYDAVKVMIAADLVPRTVRFPKCLLLGVLGV